MWLSHVLWGVCEVCAVGTQKSLRFWCVLCNLISFRQNPEIRTLNPRQFKRTLSSKIPELATLMTSSRHPVQRAPWRCISEKQSVCLCVWRERHIHGCDCGCVQEEFRGVNMLKVFVDLLSQPCRALIIFLTANKIPHTVHTVALRKGNDFKLFN